MLFPRLFRLLLLLCLFTACSSSANSVSLEDVTQSDLTSGDLAQNELAPSPDVASQPLFGIWYDGFSLPGAGPALYLEVNKINGPNLVTLFVKAKELGDVAGVAFYLTYDAESLRFVSGLNHLNFGDSGPYFTASAVRELEPGRITFGAARFCKDKIPWGSTDQCGAIEVVDATTVAALTFELVGKGQGSLRFPDSNTLLVRPDRSSVEAVWIGGTFVVEVTGAKQ
jgi:hypothetical protein